MPEERLRNALRACQPRQVGLIDRPVIQELRSLPSGTDAPNTLITVHAIKQLGLKTSVAGWFLQARQPINPAQLKSAQLMAVAQGMSVETKDDVPSMSTLINGATAFGIGLALAVLAMSVGLVRSETAGDLRVLAATGASSWARRTLSAATAGGLGLLGALLGTVAGYVGMIGLFRGSSLAGGVSALEERACGQPARDPGRDACHRRGARVGASGQRAPSRRQARHRVKPRAGRPSRCRRDERQHRGLAQVPKGPRDLRDAHPARAPVLQAGRRRPMTRRGPDGDHADLTRRA